MKADPVAAQLLVNERGGAWCGDGSRRAAALVGFFVWQEGRFFVPAYVSDRDARSVGQGRSGATRSHAQRALSREHGEDCEHRTLTGASTTRRSSLAGTSTPIRIGWFAASG